MTLRSKSLWACVQVPHQQLNLNTTNSYLLSQKPKCTTMTFRNQTLKEEQSRMWKKQQHRVVHMLATRDSKHTQSPGYQPTQPRGGRGATHPRHPCHLLAEQKVPTPSQMGEHRTHTQIPPGRPRTCTVLANTAHGGAKGMGNKKRGSPHAFMTYINPFQLRQKGEAQCLRQRSFSLSKDSVSGPIFPCSPANSLQLNSLTCSLFPFWLIICP